MAAYYNEFDSYAAQWLRNLIGRGLIANGEVDERSIIDVSPDDLSGFTQCHFFAGIGGWSFAARLAGWSDDRPIWTGSCPCQPFSASGQRRGTSDARHLWPEFFRLISARRPSVVMGEQVAAAIGQHWIDGVFDDLEGISYTCEAAVIPACAVDAPHRRDRLWFVASTQFDARALADADGARSAARISAPPAGQEGFAEIPIDGSNRRVGFWSECEWLSGADGKTRRVKPGLRLLANGVPGRLGKLRAAGNAIVPQVAAEVIAAFMDARP